MANADIANRFRTEVEYILSSRCPIALTKLQKIVEEQDEHQDAELIDEFAIANPCKLNGLVDVICDRIERYSSVIDLVLRLSSSRLFSKALIERCPELAAALITQAEKHFKVYARLGVHLVRSWHNSTSSLPIDADRFLARLVTSTVDGSSKISLLDAYDCMSASASSLTSTLSTKTVDDFLDHLSTLVKQRTPNREYEQIVGIATLYQFWRQQTKAILVRKEGWEEVAAQLFRPEKVVKAVDLVIVDVFLVTKPNTSLTPQQIERALDAAHMFISDVGPQEIKSWCQLKDSGRWLEKLCAFSSADHLSLSACQKLASLLAQVFSVEHTMVRKNLVLDRLLVSGSTPVTPDGGMTAEQFQTLLKIFGRFAAKETITQLIQRTVRILVADSNQISNNTELRYFRSLLKGLRLAASGNLLLREQIIQWLASAQQGEILSALKPVDGNASCAAGTECAITAAASRELLRVELSQLCIEVITLHNHLGVPKLDASFSLSMIRASQLASIPTPLSCAAWQVIRARPVVPASNIVPCTPSDGHTGQSWIGQIHSLAESNRRHLEESLTHLVQNTCQDLQDRCEQVEEPLQQERVHRDQAEKALAETRAACATIQSALDERDLALADVETHVCDLQQKLAAQSTQTAELQDQLQNLQADMAQKAADHKAEVEQLRAINSVTETSVQKQLSEIRDELSFCRQELQKEQGEADKLRHELDERTPELRRAQQDVSEKKDRLACLEVQLVKSKAAASELQENVQALFTKHQESERKVSEAQSLCKQSEVQITTLQEQLDTEKREHKMLLDSLAEHEGKLQTFEIRHETSLQEHANAMLQVKTKYEKQYAQLKSRSGEMQQRLEKKVEKLQGQINAQSDELADAQAAIPQFEREIEELQSQLAQKETALERVRNLQHDVLEMIGKQPTAPARQKPLVRKQPHQQSGFRVPRKQTPVPEMAEGSLGDASSLLCTVPQALGQDLNPLSPMQPGSANSSFSSGPSAKRQRQKTPVKQSAFKIPTSKQVGQAAVSTNTMGSPMKRVPLQDISRRRANLSPVKTTRRQSLRSSRKLRESMPASKLLDDGAIEELVDEEFGSEVVFSTQFSPSKLDAVTAYNDGTTLDE